MLERLKPQGATAENDTLGERGELGADSEKNKEVNWAPAILFLLNF